MTLTLVFTFREFESRRNLLVQLTHATYLNFLCFALISVPISVPTLPTILNFDFDLKDSDLSRLQHRKPNQS